jgi:hypothetical protein
MSVDHRADIYSLGVVFYEMLTGDLPLGKFAPPSRKVEVDVRLDEVVLRALENDPARRYQRASEVKSEVETIRQAPSPPAPPAGAVASPDAAPRFSRAAIVGACWAPLVFIMSLLWADAAHAGRPGQPGARPRMVAMGAHAHELAAHG